MPAVETTMIRLTAALILLLSGFGIARAVEWRQAATVCYQSDGKSIWTVYADKGTTDLYPIASTESLTDEGEYVVARQQTWFEHRRYVTYVPLPGGVTP